jgi:hypothetical protein
MSLAGNCFQKSRTFTSWSAEDQEHLSMPKDVVEASRNLNLLLPRPISHRKKAPISNTAFPTSF